MEGAHSLLEGGHEPEGCGEVAVVEDEDVRHALGGVVEIGDRLREARENLLRGTS